MLKFLKDLCSYRIWKNGLQEVGQRPFIQLRVKSDYKNDDFYIIIHKIEILCVTFKHLPFFSWNNLTNDEKWMSLSETSVALIGDLDLKIKILLI